MPQKSPISNTTAIYISTAADMGAKIGTAYFYRHMPKKSPRSCAFDIYITTALDKGDKT